MHQSPGREDFKSHIKSVQNDKKLGQVSPLLLSASPESGCLSVVAVIIAFLSNKPVVVTSLRVEAPGGGGSHVTVVATWVSAMVTGRGR